MDTPVPHETKRIRWPIGVKIYGISAVLLVLMIAVAVLTNLNFRKVGIQIALLSDYYIKLDQLMSDIRVENVREIVQIERALHAKPGKVQADGDAVAAALFKKAGDCSPAAYRPVQEEIRKAYSERQDRRLMGYRTSRLCTNLRLKRASELAAEALTQDAIKAVAPEIARFSTIQTDIDNILVARAKLHASFDKYLEQAKGGGGGNIADAQDRIDEHRLDVNRRMRAVVEKVHAGTRGSAEYARSLEKETLFLSAMVTIAACVFGVLFATIITRSLVRPVRELLGMTGAIRGGNLDVHIQIRTSDEIGQLGDSFNHMVGGLKEKESIQKMFGKYVDPDVVEKLIRGSGQHFEAGERQTMSVFFSDLEGFTTFSEGLTSSAVVRLLNVYFGLMVKAIRQEQGIIDKYIGDSVMAFWGEPFCPAGHQATLACYAALAQQAKMEEFRALLPELLGLRRNLPVINVRMGIATGDVTVGTVGSEDARSYTVIGDTVNLASRLEGANKRYGTQIIINEETRQLAGDSIEVREIDAVRVVGKMDATRIYELIGRKGDIAPKRSELRDHYELGLGCFRARQFDQARMEFEACLTIDPADGPARLFIGRIATLETQTLTESWDGVLSLTDK